MSVHAAPITNKGAHCFKSRSLILSETRKASRRRCSDTEGHPPCVRDFLELRGFFCSASWFSRRYTHLICSIRPRKSRRVATPVASPPVAANLIFSNAALSRDIADPIASVGRTSTASSHSTANQTRFVYRASTVYVRGTASRNPSAAIPNRVATATVFPANRAGEPLLRRNLIDGCSPPARCPRGTCQPT